MIASVHRRAYQLKSVVRRCSLERRRRTTPGETGSILYSPLKTSKNCPPTRTWSSRVHLGICSDCAWMEKARRSLGAQTSTSSMNRTPPVKVAWRTPPTPSADSVASRGAGNPIRRVQDGANSPGWISLTRSMFLQTSSGEAWITTDVSTLRISFWLKTFPSQGVTRSGSARTQPKVTFLALREDLRLTVYPAANPPRVERVNEIGKNRTAQIVPSQKTRTVPSVPPRMGTQGRNAHTVTR